MTGMDSIHLLIAESPLKLGWLEEDKLRIRVVRLFCSAINPFTTGNPFLGTKLLELSLGRGSGALKGLK